MTDKSLADIQREVDAYIGQFKEGYFSPLALMARMSEEVGELAREVNHYYGEKPKSLMKKRTPLKWSLAIFYLFCPALRIPSTLT